MAFPGTFALAMPAIVSASSLTGPVSPGAYLQTFADGDGVDTGVNFVSGFTSDRLNRSSFVFVVRPQASAPNQPFVTFYTGDNTSSQGIGKVQDNGSSSHRYGAFEADLSPFYGHNVAPGAGGEGSATYGDWLMIAGGFTGNYYDDWLISKINGLDPSTNRGGTSAATTLQGVENSPIHLGWPTGTFGGNNAFELAMVRIYSSPTATLTDAQSVQIWDHWASNNLAYYENNSQTLPSYNEGVEDYTTDLFAEWDFAKMPAGILQTTAGSVGTVTGSLSGGAIITT